MDSICGLPRSNMPPQEPVATGIRNRARQVRQRQRGVADDPVGGIPQIHRGPPDAGSPDSFATVVAASRTVASSANVASYVFGAGARCPGETLVNMRV